ncbi:ABC transporter permease [Mesorhizobium sp. SP-1A]|uniref:ABC transporter permease n=1 Tax=Mesorhizobium sp. SP-1A TaxID=3077840 RepID=UPI0028F6D17E|nr:ABC transporter permease [Mesorhizobium sp. SP-1A]
MSSLDASVKGNTATNIHTAAISILGFFAFALAWEIVVRLFDVPIFLVPPPSLILGDIFQFPGWFAQQAMYTIFITVGGFIAATVIGVAFAVVLVESPLLHRLLFPLFIALNSVPKVAIAPLCIIWFGMGSFTKIAIAFMIAVFAIVIDALLGLQSVSKDVLDIAKALRGSRWKVLTRIRIYAALPSIFAGMKVAMSLSLVGAIVSEFVASQNGLGNVILVAQGQFDTPRVFAALLILSLIGVLLIGSLDILERYAMPWKYRSKRKS